ncbi:MAG: hypothetical protein GY820_12655 [Gammaproteobacteria bacterium]|nr:hypothetical protein [Gammaproteobacteria bacterium]
MLDFQIKKNLGDTDDSRTSTKAGAKEQNSRNYELKNAVETTGQTLTDNSTQDDTNTNQLAKAMGIYGRGSFSFQDNGSANTYQLIPVTGASGIAVPNASDGGYALFEGAIVYFNAANTNTGTSTASVGQTVGTLLGAKSIRVIGGAVLTGGEIVAGQYITLKFDISNDYWEIVANSASISVPDASETVKGISKLSTQALTDGGVDDTTTITPLKLKNALKIPNLSTFTTSGSFPIPTDGDYRIIVSGGGGGGGGGTVSSNSTAGGNTTVIGGTVNISATGGARGFNADDAGPGGTNVGGTGGDYAILGGGSVGGRGWSVGNGDIGQSGQPGGQVGFDATLTTATTLTITIGAGGTGAQSDAHGGPGASGYVKIMW